MGYIKNEDERGSMEAKTRMARYCRDIEMLWE